MNEQEFVAGVRKLLSEYDGAAQPKVTKEPFPTEGLRQTLDATFTSRPKFASGKATPLAKGSRPPGLDDAGFEWRAGLVNAALGMGLSSAAWRPGKPYPGFSSLPTNKEAQVYPNQDAIDATGVDPISFDGESLVLAASRLPEELRPHLPAGSAFDFVSGAFTSFPYAQTYGIFEWEVELPEGRGLWPAGWLLPVDMAWPPEIDVFEVLGHDMATAHTTVHSKATGRHKGEGKANAVKNLAEGVHRFALRWTAEKLEWAVDGEILFEAATPADLQNRPCYLLTNLAVGGEGSWPGAPDARTEFPAYMKVRSIKVWAL